MTPISLKNFPKGWQRVKLGQVVHINPKPTRLPADAEEIGFISMADVSNDAKIGRVQERLFSDVKKGFTVFEPHDVLFAKITPCMENGKGALVPSEYQSFFGSTEFHVLRASDQVIPAYVFQLVNQSSFRKTAGRNMKGSAGQRRVPREFLENYDLDLPPLNEQRGVAEILEAVDEKIQKTDEIITTTDKLKKGLMRQLFTRGIGHTKFKKTKLGQIPENWEIITLGDIGTNIIGLTYSPKDVVQEGGTLVLRSSNIKGNALVYSDNVYVSKEIRSHLITKKGDILLCTRNGSRDLIGKSAYIDDKSEGNSFGAFMSVYRTSHSDFVFQLFQSPLFKDQVNKHIGATINQITTGVLNTFVFALPPAEEQEKIVGILSAIDEKTSINQELKAKLILLKKGLMRDLLSGKVRVINK